MGVRIQAFSTDNGNASQFRVYSGGAEVGDSPIAATFVSNRFYFGDMPASLGPAGLYSFALHRTTGTANAQSRTRSTGEFYWDGTDIVLAEELLIDIRQLARADEQYSVDGTGNGSAQKLLEGTATVLLSKTVTTDAGCPQNTVID